MNAAVLTQSGLNIALVEGNIMDNVPVIKLKNLPVMHVDGHGSLLFTLIFETFKEIRHCLSQCRDSLGSCAQTVIYDCTDGVTP